MAEGGTFEIFSTAVRVGLVGAAETEAELEQLSSMADALDDIQLGVSLDGDIQGITQQIEGIAGNLPDQDIPIRFNLEQVEQALGQLRELEQVLGPLTDQEREFFESINQTGAELQAQLGSVTDELANQIDQLAAFGLPSDEVQAYTEELEAAGAEYESLVELIQQINDEVEKLSESSIDLEVSVDNGSISEAIEGEFESNQPIRVSFGGETSVVDDGRTLSELISDLDGSEIERELQGVISGIRFQIQELSQTSFPTDQIESFRVEIQEASGDLELLRDIRSRLATELRGFTEPESASSGLLQRVRDFEQGLSDSSTQPLEDIDNAIALIGERIKELDQAGFPEDQVNSFRDELKEAGSDYKSLIDLNRRVRNEVVTLGGTDLDGLKDSLDGVGDAADNTRISVERLLQEIDNVFQERNAGEFLFDAENLIDFSGIDFSELEFDEGPLTRLPGGFEAANDAAGSIGSRMSTVLTTARNVTAAFGTLVASVERTVAFLTDAAEQQANMEAILDRQISQERELLEIQRERIANLAEAAQNELGTDGRSREDLEDFQAVTDANVDQLGVQLSSAQQALNEFNSSRDQFIDQLGDNLLGSSGIAGALGDNLASSLLTGFSFVRDSVTGTADEAERLQSVVDGTSERLGNQKDALDEIEDATEEIRQAELDRQETVANINRDLDIQLALAQGNVEEAERLTDEKERQADLARGLTEEEAAALAIKRDQIEAEERLAEFERERRDLALERARVNEDEAAEDAIEREQDIESGLTPEQADALAAERDLNDIAQERVERAKELERLQRDRTDAIEKEAEAQEEARKDELEDRQDIFDLQREQERIARQGQSLSGADAAAGLISGPIDFEQDRREAIEESIDDIRKRSVEREEDLNELAQERLEIEAEIAALQAQELQDQQREAQARADIEAFDAQQTAFQSSPAIPQDGVLDITSVLNDFIDQTSIDTPDLTAPLDAQTAVLEQQSETQTMMLSCLDQQCAAIESIRTDLAANRTAVETLSRLATDPTTGGGGIFSNC